ncbi:RNA polymerase subunit sigma-24 [Thiomicrospira aerophila AL3]|uniref:RNA polymerase sigma factor n=1 Tax=Thiomicrospira aerophila AL3 TaxID=717772 RepID=W0DVG2_9GAMM|nr:RNA polymerase sigma factor [Thiomicrospira aerophila]AHF00856.1 RNA polymerase subunit sigma-24 [Thiomicrospira aerophila AL3]
MLKYVQHWLKQSTAKTDFNSLLSQQTIRLYQLAYAWTHQPSLSEDLVQETLLKAIEHKDQLKELDQLLPWLCKILHNLYIDKLRYQQQWQSVTEEAIDFHYHHPSSEDEYLADEAIDSLEQAMIKLTASQRQIITLIDLQELSYQQTAEILDIPMGTVMSRLSRARKELERQLMTNKPANKDNVIAMRKPS